jgi:activating signal cointegrator 1
VTTWTQIKEWNQKMKVSGTQAPDGMMKALTICQPYAEEIMIPRKRVENRTWYTGYRGPLLIHAGKSRAWLDGDTDEELEARYGRRLEFGAIVGLVRMVDCIRASDIWDGKYEAKYPGLLAPEHQHHINGPWCFVLAEAMRFPQAIPYRGAQGFFMVPESNLASPGGQS